MDGRYIGAMVVLGLLIVATAFVYFKEHPLKGHSTPRTIAATAIFGGMAAVLYAVPVFNFSLPFFPSFLSIHVDEIPCFIAAFAYGPYAGFGAIVVKTLVKLPMTSTMGVGELADFLLSTIFVVTSAFIYKKHRSLKGVGVAFLISTVLQVVAAMVLNVYLLIPFYSNVMAGLDEATLLAICQMAMPWISDIGWSYALCAVLPFNLLKDAIVIVLTFIVYRYTHRLIKAENEKTAQ